MSQQLNVQNLVVDLQTEVGMARAVDALNITLQKGQTFALVGESGCGKSMTALSLLRLLPDNAVIQNGKVNLSDLDVFQLSENQMRTIRGRRISIIFQEPSTSLNPVMTVGDQILEVIHQHTELRAEDARSRAIDWLKKVGLPEPERRMGSYPFEMSGGQLQRVMIAIALAAEPDLLIADEPTTALDVTIQAQILDLLKSLQQERGMAMLLITHDLAVVSGMADQVALMYAGQIVEVASAADFFVRPSHPYAKLLLQALPGEDLRGRQLAAIHGTVPPLTQAFKGCRFAPRCPYQTDACTEKAVVMTALSESHNVRCVRVNDVTLQSLSLPPLLERLSESAHDHSVLLSVKDLSVTYSMGGGVLGGKKTFQAVKNV
ncbi:MAG: Glutathione import ATP-binding protein GsiA, partial [Pseudomonadota bacterium]